MRRIRLRTLMILVAVLAVLMGSVGPGLRTYRRWSFYHSRASFHRRFEQSERLRASQEQKIAADREALRATLMKSTEFATRRPADLEAAMNAEVEFHRLQSKEARRAAERSAEQWRDCETAAFWCWDPYAPDVP
jgi:hypothetical protein